jgi:hypothetical protein
MRGEFLLGLNRAVRESASVQAGDTVEVAIELDTAPREVDVPEALASALAADPAASAAFKALAFSHRKEYARWTADAKRQETRAAALLKRFRCCANVRRSADSSAHPPISLSAHSETGAAWRVMLAG